MNAILIATFSLFSLTALGDLNAWNDGTNSSIRVNSILAQSITNTALTASRVMLSGADKSIGSVSTTGIIKGDGTAASSGSDYAPATSGSNFLLGNGSGGFATTGASSALSGALTDETGSGVSVFGTSPTFTTSIAITNAATGTNPLTINDASGASGNRISLSVGGAFKFRVDESGNVISTNAIIGRGSSMDLFSSGEIRAGVSVKFGGNTDVFGPSANVLQLGTTAASPSNQELRAALGTGTDKNGAYLTLEGGQPTGTGTGGGVVIRTGVTSTTGSTAGTYRDRARYVPKFVDLTDASAISLFTVSLPATNIIGITFSCTVQCSNGTDFQSLTTVVTVDAVAKTTTITPVLAPTAAQTAVAASSGTLSVTYTVVDNGSNVFAVKCNADTSLTSLSYLRAQYVMMAINGSGVGWSITEL